MAKQTNRTKKPSDTKIQFHLRQLRKFIDSTDDDVAARMAYVMEFTLKWATEPTWGWPTLLSEAKENAKVVRSEIKREEYLKLNSRG